MVGRSAPDEEGEDNEFVFFLGVDGIEAAGEHVVEETTMLYAHCYVTHIQSAPRRRKPVA